MRYYPILVDLQGKKVIVVGGGTVAQRKIETLLAHGAVVFVIARELNAPLSRHVETGAIRLAGQEFKEEDLNDAFMVIAATDDPLLNRLVGKHAKEKGILINAVDQPSDCNFIVPSILRRGDLLIAVSTSGKSPAMAKRVREELEEKFGDEYEAFLNLMGWVRKEILSHGRAQGENSRKFHELVNSLILGAIDREDWVEVASILNGIVQTRLSPEEVLLFRLALFLLLLSTGGFIVYISKQQKPVYRWSYRFLLASFVCHTIFLGYQYYSIGVAPVFTFKAALSFFSWTIIGAYLIFHLKFRLMILGSFIAPLAACLMIISTTIPGIEITVQPMFRSLWLTVHVFLSFMGNGMFAVAFSAAIMYLIQENQIKKKKLGSFYTRLPSLETLDTVNHYSLMYGFPLITLGMITGAIYAQYVLGKYWRWDPKEVWSLITWLFYATLLHQRLTVGWRGRRAAIMSIIAFLILIFTFVGASLWLSDYHSFKSLEGRTGL